MNELPDSKSSKTDDDKIKSADKSVESQSENSSNASPIDVEFEDVSPQADSTPFEQRNTTEKSAPGWGALLTTGAFASIIGAAIAMVATGSSSIDTAKFAPAEVKNQIVAVEKIQKDLNQRVQDVRSALSAVEASQNSSIEEIKTSLEARIEGEKSIRSELENLITHLEFVLDDQSATVADDNADNSVVAANGNDPLDVAEIDNENKAEGNANIDSGKTVQQPSRLIALLTKIDDLETKIGDLQATKTDMESAKTAEFTEDIKQSIVDLEERLTAIEVAEENLTKAMNARSEAVRALNLGLNQTQKAIQSVEADIEQLHREQKQQISAAQSLIANSNPTFDPVAKASLALSQVIAASSRGKPFSEAWLGLSESLPTDENVAALKDIARRGAPTLDELTEKFRELEESLVANAKAETKGDGWDWVKNALAGIITVKRTAGDNINNSGRLYNISKALNAQNLEEAVKNAKAMEGSLSPDFQNWLDGANRRLELVQHINAIRKTVLESSGVLLPPAPAVQMNPETKSESK